MNIHKKIKDNVILNCIESQKYFYIDTRKSVEYYELSFTYFGLNYLVKVKDSDLSDSWFRPNVQGGGELFDSFVEACEDYLEDPIKEAINDYKSIHQNTEK